MTAFKEIQIVHAGPLAETQVYVVEGWVTGEAILSGDPRGVVCLCLMPEMAPRLVALLNMDLHDQETAKAEEYPRQSETHRGSEAVRTNNI